MAHSYAQWTGPVKAAHESASLLNITAGNSKTFYGCNTAGNPLDMQGNSGIVEYDPAELVIVARSGTTLQEIQETLAKQGQKLGFEPPFSEQGATLGGAIATGLAGSSRASRGSVRDYLLGAKIINGKGDIMQFGGKVMKNVAGFDLFRPMAGAMGTLGVILEASLRVIPIPEAQTTLVMDKESQQQAIVLMCQLGQTLSGLSACAWHNKQLIIRLSGSSMAIKRDQGLLQKYHAVEHSPSIWPQIDSFQHAFFTDAPEQDTVAVIDVPPATIPIELIGQQLINWAGARRYYKGTMNIEDIRAKIKPLSGSVIYLQGPDQASFFEPLSAPLMSLHKRLKQTFDPAGIFNSGRLYPEL